MTIPNAGYAPWIVQGEDGIVVRQEGLRVRISGAGVVAQLGATYFMELETDETISAQAPTPPFTFPAGQPETLLTLSWTSVTGRAILSASFNGALQWDSAEIDPLLWLFLRLDGVDIQGGIVALTDNAAPSELQAITGESSFSSVRTVAPNVLHTLELRWGVLGGVPDVSAVCLALPGGNSNHATLMVQEVMPL